MELSGSHHVHHEGKGGAKSRQPEQMGASEPKFISLPLQRQKHKPRPDCELLATLGLVRVLSSPFKPGLTALS